MNIDLLKIPYAKLLSYKLQSSSILLYGVLLYHAYNKGNTWITNRTLSEECNVSERTIGNCLKELKEQGCIDIRYEKENRFEIRYITPLVLFDVKITPNNYKARKGAEAEDDNAGFEVL